MNCPYCYSMLIDTVSNDKQQMAIGNCPYCKHYPGINYVTINFQQGEVFNSFIRITLVKKHAENNQIYSIYSYFKLNMTQIYSESTSNNIFGFKLDLPGCPITPQNAKEKLHLYILLS